MATYIVNSVYDLISKLYGAEVSREDPATNLSLGVADLIVLQNNPRRLSFVVVNLSANVVYLKPNAPATATSGIRLAASGGSLTVNFLTDLHLASLEWHGLASGAASTIYITSVVLR